MQLLAAAVTTGLARLEREAEATRSYRKALSDSKFPQADEVEHGRDLLLDDVLRPADHLLGFG